MATADVSKRADNVDLTTLGLPPVGTVLMVVGDDDATTSVVVERALNDRLVAAVAGDRVLAGGHATIRWFEPSRPSAEADALVSPSDDPALVELRICSPWRPADGRRSARLAAHRPMVARVMQMVDNTLVPNVRLNLVCLDLSATGLRRHTTVVRRASMNWSKSKRDHERQREAGAGPRCADRTASVRPVGDRAALRVRFSGRTRSCAGRPQRHRRGDVTVLRPPHALTASHFDAACRFRAGWVRSGPATPTGARLSPEKCRCRHFAKPSSRLELLTPSLPWRCSTN